MHPEGEAIPLAHPSAAAMGDRTGLMHGRRHGAATVGVWEADGVVVGRDMGGERRLAERMAFNARRSLGQGISVIM